MKVRQAHVAFDEDEKPQQSLAGSWLGLLFSVDYCLRVFVKYDSFMKRGEGEYITMPIKILNTPFLGKTDEPFRVPDQWDPFQCNHKQVPVQMDTEDGLSEYFKTVTRPRWRKWHGRMTDLEKKLEDALFLTLEKERQAKEKHDEALGDKEETKSAIKVVKPRPGGIPTGGQTGSENRITD